MPHLKSPFSLSSSLAEATGAETVLPGAGFFFAAADADPADGTIRSTATRDRAKVLMGDLLEGRSFF
jgi:hypothetical protein